jgi:transposase
MAAAVAPREDFTAARMRALARSSRDANQVRRLLTLAAIYEGGTRSDAAALGGVGLQTVRDWVLRFNVEGPDGLIDVLPPGGVPLLSDDQRQALAQIVEDGPFPASHGVVRWRLIDLALWVWDEFAISVSKQTLSRELRGMGYRKLTARPRHHAQDDDAIPTFKKVSRPGGGDPGNAPARPPSRTVVARRGPG